MAAASSVIAEGTIVRGNVKGSGSLEIRGHVEGDVEIDGDVALTEGAGVEGNVTGAQLVIAGQVAGDLKGSEAVLLERGARVVGDLVAPRIGIADGALVRGHVKTEGEAAPPRRAQVAVSRRAPERPAAEPSKTKTEAAAPEAPAKAETEEAEPKAKRSAGGPPAPVVPALGKGVRGKKKRAKRA